MNNRGITRARIVFGGLILVAAVIAWGTGFLLSPHSNNTVAGGTDHVRGAVVVFLRNSAIGTLVLSAIAAWLLFPSRRPRKPWRDYGIIAVLAVLVLTSLYQLVWLRTAL